MELFYYFIAAAAVFICQQFQFAFFTHMFQLNSYVTKAQLKWLKKNIFRKSAFINKKKQKKKFTFTPRVMRLCITFNIIVIIMVTVLLILPLNIYVFIALLVLQYWLTPLTVILCNYINKPIEKMVFNYFVNDAKRILRESKNLKVIGITGSFGKTSTKYFLKELLSVKYETLMTPANYNTTLGVVRTVRNYLKPTDEIFVCEMGARNVGDIKEICDIVKPDAAVITSIGYQHLETFGSIENVIKTKFELADSLSENGLLFLNFDNTFIRDKKVTAKTVTYGIDNDGADREYKAVDINFSNEGTSFMVVGSNERQEFQTNILGLHNVLNITCAIAVANKMGIPMNKMVQAVKRLQSVPHRLQLIKKGNMSIIDDAYNSNIDGAKSALDCLGGFSCLKILITPGMVELGAKEAEMNFEFGAYAAKICDLVVLIGEKQTKDIYNGLVSNGYLESQIVIKESFNEGFKIAEEASLSRQTAVLIENDLPDNY